MAAKKKPSPRTARRTADRAASKLADARTRLAALEEGGSPARPIEITSASLVELTATSRPCPRCDGALRVEEHAARTIDGVPLRLAHVRCPTCGHARTVYLRIVTTLPS